MESWFELKVRAILVPEEKDDKEVVIWGRVVRWLKDGIEYEADPKHRKIILEYFGFDRRTKPSVVDGDKEDKVEEWEEEFLGKAEAKEFRGLAA
eukprot:3221690-Karenia_brevis.AAC.1